MNYEASNRDQGPSTELLYQAAIRAMSEGFVLHAADGSICEANPSAQRILGLTLDQMMGRSAIDPRWRLVRADGSPLPPDEIPSEITRRTGQPCRQHLLGVHRENGELAWLHVTTDPVGPAGTPGLPVVALFADVTAQRDVEAALRRAQRREAMADLAAGIAHNFNNMLAVILPGIELALSSDSPASREHLRDAHTAARNAAGLVRELLALTRASTVELEAGSADLVAVTHEVARLCRQTFDCSITIEERIAVPCAWVPARSTLLHQAVLNLCLNARDAMADSAERKLTLELSMERGASGGPEAVLCVSDTGCGMDAATSARIGEPFFTTKAPGHGTGLGIATVFHTARELGGSLEHSTQLGLGTRFTLRLPAHAAHDAPSAPDEPSASQAIRATPRAQRILLVDDEPLVRKALARGLTRAGRTVTEAERGRDALALVRATPDAFDAVLLDLALPDVHGTKVLAELRTEQPRLAVIVLSGFIDENADVTGARAVLSKPVALDRLLATLDAVE